MKKLMGIIILMVVLSIGVFGAKEELKNEDGKYSGSASIGLVATGKIIERIPQSMLVLKIEDEKGNIDNVINFSYIDVKLNEERKVKGKMIAQIYKEDRYGKMQLSDFDKTIKTEIINENAVENTERVLKTINGNEVGKISYELGESKKLKNKFETEVINKIAINQNKSGVFIDRNSSLKVVIEDLVMVY